MYRKESLENKIPQKGVVSEEGLCHVLSYQYASTSIECKFCRYSVDGY